MLKTRYGGKYFVLLSGGTILDAVDLETPPFRRETLGIWVDVPKGIIQLMRAKGLNPAEGIHSAQHAILNRFSLAAELRTECKVPKKEYMAGQSSRKRPARLIFYDIAGKNGGVAARAFDHGNGHIYPDLVYPLKLKAAVALVSSLVHDAFAVVDSCPCEEGCVNCEPEISNRSYRRYHSTFFPIGVDSPACKEANEVSSKLGAQVILCGILGLTIDLNAIPDYDPGSVPETIIEAESVRALDGVEVEVYDSN